MRLPRVSRSQTADGPLPICRRYRLDSRLSPREASVDSRLSLRESSATFAEQKATFHAVPAGHTVLIFPSELGWMAAVLTSRALRQLTFGHASAAAARAALSPDLAGHARTAGRPTPLERRLQAYASGKPDEFRDIPVDVGPVSDFHRRICQECRRIPYGRAISYAALAARAGFPRAARAVGNCMAGNRVPLVVPCHRVVRSDRAVGSYSAVGGAAMKRRLLELESAQFDLEFAGGVCHNL